MTLAHGGGKIPERIRASARAQALHFWPALAVEDALHVPELPSPAFTRYLVEAGASPPVFTTALRDAKRLFTPFGWNAEAHRLARLNAHPLAGPAARGPSFEVARKVNGRAFGASLERRLFPEDACPGRFWATPSELREELGSLPPGRYVAKGNYGLAGIGHLRFEVRAAGEAGEGALTGGAGEGAQAFAEPLRRLLERHDGLRVEQEQKVEQEFGILFRMNRAGRTALRAHRLWTFADGGYAGSLVLPGEDPLFAPWRARLEDHASKIASALANEEYFGPVSLDTYLWRDASHIDAPARLRPLVDLNARASMAWPAHGLAARFPGRAAAVAQLPAAALQVPRDPGALARAWGSLAFDPARGTGALWLTPFDAAAPLPRHSLGFVGADAEEVEGLRDAVLRLSLRSGFAPGGFAPLAGRRA